MPIANSQQHTSPKSATVQARQHGFWGVGDHTRIGVSLPMTGEQLCETLDLRAGQSVLDVASGNGNASLAAARRFCRVVATGHATPALDKSRKRAEAEGLPIDYRLADIEALPFADAQFDNVLSTFGVMFTVNPSQATTELTRVCKPGGKIGLANWMPQGFFGQLVNVIESYIPLPKGVFSPSAWGNEEFIQTTFHQYARSIATFDRTFSFRYQSPTHWVDVFMADYDANLSTFDTLVESGYKALRQDMLSVVNRFNTATDGTMVVPSEYIDAVIVCSDP